MSRAFGLGAVMIGLMAVAGCGGGGGDSGMAGVASADCPPLQKGNGVMVSSRYDYEDLIEANRWRTEMFPRSCAGNLAALVPDMPDGFGVKPTNKPYIMTDDHVYVAYAELPDPLYLEEDMPNIPMDLNSIEYEIVRFEDEDMAKVRSWMDNNPNAYLSGEVDGHAVHLIGGFGTGRPGKGDRLSTSLHAFPGNNLVVRISHKSLFTQRGGLDISPLVQEVMDDILDRAASMGEP